MRKRNALLLSCLTMVSGVTLAHGPTRQKVVIEEQIAAAPTAVWDVVKDFQDMSWHPAVADTEGEGGNIPGATRVLTLGDGGQIHEKLEKYDDVQHAYFYRIEQVDVAVLPVTNYSSWFSVLPGDDGGSLVRWKGAFYRGYPNNDPPPELNDQAAVKAVTGVYEAGLSNLKTLIENKAE